MSDEILESNQITSDADTQASVAGQESLGDEHASNTVTLSIKELEDLVEKKVQSQKDRRFAKLEGEQEQLLQYYQQLTGQPIDQTAFRKAQREMQIDELLNNPQASTSAQRATHVSAGEMSYGNILQQYNLSVSDPDVSRLIAENAPVSDLIFLAGQRKTRSESPSNVATVAAAGTGAPAPAASQEQLRNQYTEELARVRGNTMAVIELRRKYAEKGLQLERPV